MDYRCYDSTTTKLYNCGDAEGFQEAKDQVKIPYIANETDESLRYRTLMNSYRRRVDYLKTLKGTLVTYEVVPESKHDSHIVTSPPVLVDFDKITIRWLIDHLPTSKWVALVAILIGSFLLGATMGQTTFIRELLGKSVDSQTAPKLTSEEFKNRIDQLTQGHNSRRQKLIEAIIDQQRGLAMFATNDVERRQARLL
jgi:hypothetical protein